MDIKKLFIFAQLKTLKFMLPVFLPSLNNLLSNFIPRTYVIKYVSLQYSVYYKPNHFDIFFLTSLKHIWINIKIT